MFYAYSKEKRIKTAILAAGLLLCTYSIFPQNDMSQRSSIPEELLRPRRDEAPRYPVDTVIGALGRGRAPQEAYDVAKNAAAAFLAGNMDAAVFYPVNSVFVESCMSMLNAINPQSFRLGGGREEPDGSVSFLVRFVGREQGITGELFVRFEERQSRPKPEPEPEPEPAAIETEIESDEESDSVEQAEIPPPPPPPPQNVSVQKIWLFEDLILEEARNRESENKEDRHRFDFSPYERIF